MTEKTKDVKVARLVQPEFLTLAGLPANQVAFKVVRNDEGEANMQLPHIQRKRARRADKLLSIAFEEGVTDEQIQQAMADWGLTDYTVSESEGRKLVLRSDGQGAETIDVDLGSGRIATILKPISPIVDEVKRGLTVASVSFDAEAFPDTESVKRWCESNSIDFPETQTENGDQHTVVRRAEAEGESRSMEVDTGVVFTVVRSDTSDIPEGFVAIVNDTAYGNWGWGQLDFAAAIADKEFCNVANDAAYTLSSVVDRILFYSDLPVNIRKDLLVRASTQFAEFVGSLLDALPARVVIATRSSEKEKFMSKTVDAARSEIKDQAVVITREDVAAMIAESVNPMSAKIDQLLAQRAEPAAAPTEPADKAQRSDNNPAAPELQEVTRSLSTIADSLKGINDRLAAVEGATVVRSDATDETKGDKKVARKDPFYGMFGRTASK